MRAMSWGLVALLVTACGGGAQNRAGAGGGAPKLAARDALDVAPVRDELTVFTDGKSHYIAALLPDPEREPPADEDLLLFYGDGKVFDSVKVYSASDAGLRFDIGFDDPRIAYSPLGNIVRTQGKVALHCSGEDVPLTQLSADQAQAMLRAATFRRRTPRWHPMTLGKDDRDVYTYVDTGNARDNHRKYRVFVGQKGKLQKLDIVKLDHDDEWLNLSFGTKQGTLKLHWVQKRGGGLYQLGWEGKPELTAIQRNDNWRLIFEELGVYPEGRSPTPCEPMLAKPGS
jgi:hypothetical protein